MSDSSVTEVPNLDTEEGYCFMVAAFIPSRPKSTQLGAWSKQLCVTGPRTFLHGTSTHPTTTEHKGQRGFKKKITLKSTSSSRLICWITVMQCFFDIVCFTSSHKLCYCNNNLRWNDLLPCPVSDPAELSVGVWVGAVAILLVVLVIIIAVTVLCCRWCRRKRNDQVETPQALVPR